MAVFFIVVYPVSLEVGLSILSLNSEFNIKVLDQKS